MPAWNYAHRAARATLSESTTRPTGGDFIDPAVDGVRETVCRYDFDDPTECVVCGEKRKLRTGYLPTLGGCRICSAAKCGRIYRRMNETMTKYANRGVRNE